MDFWEFILLWISVVVFLWFLLSVVFILWWGLLLILSGGKEEKTKPAINTIRYAILWIFITVGAIFIAPILWNVLWMPEIAKKYFSPTAIYENIRALGNKMFNWSNTNPWRSDIYDWNDSTTLDDLDF